MAGDVRVADVAVIGGGIAGACAAFRLAAAGARVVLLERRRLAGATTGKSSAVVGAFYGAVSECLLALATLDELERFDQDVGGDIAFRQVGLLELAGHADAASLLDSVEARRAAGADITLLDPAAAAAAFPDVLVEGIQVGAFERRAGYLDPVALTQAYATAAGRCGAVIAEQCAALALIVRGGQVRGVDTTAGRVDCEAVVVANGIGAIDLLDPLGIDFGLTPRSVQYARFASSPASPPDLPGLPDPPGLPGLPDLPVVLDDSQAFWFRADGDQVMAGLEFVAAGLLSDHEARQHALLCGRKLRRRLGVPLAPAPVSYGMATVGMSPDGRPIVDQVEGFRGLFVMVGDSGISLKFAPIGGRCVAEWYVTGAPRSADISPFSAARLRGGGAAVTLRPGGYRRAIHLLRELRSFREQPTRLLP